MLLFYLAGSGNHRCQFLRNIVDHGREEFLCHHGPGWTAGGQKERKITGSDFFGIMVCFGNCTDISTESNFMYIGKAQNLQRGFEFTWCYIIAKLTDICRGNDRNNFISVAKRVRKLENLRFIRNCTKRAAYHTHTT